MLTSIRYTPHISITLLLFRAVGPFFNDFWVRNGRVGGAGDWSVGRWLRHGGIGAGDWSVGRWLTWQRSAWRRGNGRLVDRAGDLVVAVAPGNGRSLVDRRGIGR